MVFWCDVLGPTEKTAPSPHSPAPFGHPVGFHAFGEPRPTTISWVIIYEYPTY